MQEKPCIECAASKPLTAYYKHPQMLDGRLGVCKECHKRRMKIRSLISPKVQEYNRARAKTPKVKARIRAISERWNRKHPEAYRAHYLVSNAIRDGRLQRLPCVICGNEKSQAHHQDYSRPLDVKWLCAKCHHRIHATFPELGGHHVQSHVR